MGEPAILYEAIFFDFDGVLVESTALKIGAFETLYAEHGLDIVSRVMNYIKGREGISRVEKIKHAHKEFLGVDLTETELSELAIKFATIVEDEVVACPWVPGAGDLLSGLSSKLPLFVVTGTPDGEIQRIVDRRNMRHLFTSVHGSPPRKPPIVRELLIKYDLTPGHCLFVGDALFDYETAMETGLDFVGRICGHLPDPFPEGTRTVADMASLGKDLDIETAPVAAT